MRHMRRMVLAVLACAWPLAAAAQAPREVHADIPRVTTPPTLADYLGAGAKPGLQVTAFLQREPKDLEPGTQPTSAYLSYDQSNLYVAFVCTQAPGTVRARMTRREGAFADDLVGVLLDTFHDRQRAYAFYVSPLGIQADGVMSAQGEEDFSFDTTWDSRGTITPDGFTVLIAVPFKSLRFPAGSGPQQWGVGLVRLYQAGNEWMWWPAATQRVNGLVQQFATVTGFDGVAPGRNIQVNPYGTFTGARFLDRDAGADARRREGRAGVDVKLVPREATTLDMTFNPDFSQVESDEPQVTVNQRFEVFFPEKRPFFLENADYFSAFSNVFFSRRIRDPQVGARFTGKFGRWSTGALVADDRAPGRAVSPSSDAYGDRAWNAVGSARYAFANQSTLSFVGTARRFGPASNVVGSGTVHLRLNPRWFFDAEGIVSHDTSASGATTNGTSLFVGLQRGGRQVNYSLTYFAASKDLALPLGFVPRRDFRNLNSFLSYRWRPKSGPVLNFGPNSYIDAVWATDGRLLDWTVRFPFFIQFRGQTSVFIRHAEIEETLGDLKLRQREELLQAQSDRWKWLSLGATVSTGSRPNYFPAAGVLPFLGDFLDVSANAVVRPAARLSFGETVLWSRLDGRAGTPAAGGRIFDNWLLRSRIDYQFSREWSLRAILDVNSLTPNAAVVGLERGRHLGGDLLLTWLLHPGTALYLGYADGYDNVRVNPNGALVTTDGALRSTGRQVFIKLGWLFRP